MPILAISSGLSPVMSFPNSLTDPAVGLKTPDMILNTVVLPAPFGPISPYNARSEIERSKLLTAARPPNCIPIFSQTSAKSFIFDIAHLHLLM